MSIEITVHRSIEYILKPFCIESVIFFDPVLLVQQLTLYKELEVIYYVTNHSAVTAASLENSIIIM